MKGQETVNVAVQVKTVESKENQIGAKTEESQLSAQGLVEFVGDVKSELKKITWTSSDELRVYTKLVVGMTFVIGMLIYFWDLIIHFVLNFLNAVFHWIA